MLSVMVTVSHSIDAYIIIHADTWCTIINNIHVKSAIVAGSSLSAHLVASVAGQCLWEDD